MSKSETSLHPVRETSMPVFQCHGNALWKIVDKDLPRGTVLVLMYLLMNCDTESGVMHKRHIDRIATDLKLSRPTVYRAFSELEDAGLFKANETNVGGELPIAKMTHGVLARRKEDNKSNNAPTRKGYYGGERRGTTQSIGSLVEAESGELVGGEDNIDV